MGQKEEADSQPGDRAGLGRRANLSQGLRASAPQVLRQENGTVTPTYSPLCFWSARLFPRADSHSHSKQRSSSMISTLISLLKDRVGLKKKADE